MEEATLSGAQLAQPVPAGDAATPSPHDLHAYTLAAQVHWAAEGARLAIGRLLREQSVPTPSDEKNFSDLHQRIDATIAYLREVPAADLEAGLERTIVVEHRGGATSCSGNQFLLAYAIPHFHYHVTAAHVILRSQGMRLRMGDFLGDWGAV